MPFLKCGVFLFLHVSQHFSFSIFMFFCCFFIFYFFYFQVNIFQNYNCDKMIKTLQSDLKRRWTPCLKLPEFCFTYIYFFIQSWQMMLHLTSWNFQIMKWMCMFVYVCVFLTNVFAEMGTRSPVLKLSL